MKSNDYKAMFDACDSIEEKEELYMALERTEGEYDDEW